MAAKGESKLKMDKKPSNKENLDDNKNKPKVEGQAGSKKTSTTNVMDKKK